MHESSLEFHNEKDIKVPFLHATIYLYHKSSEFRMFACVLTECCSFSTKTRKILKNNPCIA